LELIEIESGQLIINDTHFGRFNAKTTFSWNEASNTTANTNDALFTFVFRAQSLVELSSSVSLSHAITRSEAYVGKELSIYHLELNIQEDLSKIELMQNTPNPFAYSTTIGFRIPELARIQFVIHDLSGKEIKVIEGTYEKGLHIIELDRKDIPLTGVYYYSLNTADYAVTKKLIVLE